MQLLARSESANVKTLDPSSRCGFVEEVSDGPDSPSVFTRGSFGDPGAVFVRPFEGVETRTVIPSTIVLSLCTIGTSHTIETIIIIKNSPKLNWSSPGSQIKGPRIL